MCVCVRAGAHEHRHQWELCESARTDCSICCRKNWVYVAVESLFPLFPCSGQSEDLLFHSVMYTVKVKVSRELSFISYDVFEQG